MSGPQSIIPPVLDSGPFNVPAIRLLPLCPPVQSCPTPAASARLPRRPSSKHPFGWLDNINSSLGHWAVSRHICPAAFPRSLKGSAIAHDRDSLARIDDGSPIDGKTVAQFLNHANISSERLENSKDLGKTPEPQLFQTASRYYRTIPSKKHRDVRKERLTLICTHGNGLHNEIWEPTLNSLLNTPAEDSIDEIWSLDVVNQGDSALLNQDAFGHVFEWSDGARDTLQFVLSYLPEHNSQLDSQPPTVLPHLDSPDPSLLLLDYADLIPRAEKGIQLVPGRWRGRRIALLGHSYGGCIATLACTSVPQIFSALLLVEPVVTPEVEERPPAVINMSARAAARQTRWKDREEAIEQLPTTVSCFGRWHPAVLQCYTNFALVEDVSGGGVKLKASRVFEASVYTDALMRSVLSYNRLLKMKGLLVSPALAQQVIGANRGHIPELRIVLAGRNRSMVMERIIPQWIESLDAQSDVVRIEGSGHTIVQECPVELGIELARFILGLHLPMAERKFAKL